LSKPDVLAVAKLHPFDRQALEALYTVQDRTHLTDPVTFAALALCIMGVTDTGMVIRGF
jgi:hypothetical protein